MIRFLGRGSAFAAEHNSAFFIKNTETTAVESVQCYNMYGLCCITLLKLSHRLKM